MQDIIRQLWPNLDVSGDCGMVPVLQILGIEHDACGREVYIDIFITDFAQLVIPNRVFSSAENDQGVIVTVFNQSGQVLLVAEVQIGLVYRHEGKHQDWRVRQHQQTHHAFERVAVIRLRVLPLHFLD